MRNGKLKESAAPGAVGAHSIAVRADAGGTNDYPMKRRPESLLDFMTKFQNKVANRAKFKSVKKPFNISINENVSLDQIYSKLSGIENSSRNQDDNSVTYGVEDDEGNIMKITVRGDQGTDFETALAQELADVESYKMTGRGGKGRDVSMAEVLFNLKQQFDVIDVEFPEIPSDKVYNADKISDPSEVPEPDFDDNLDSGFDEEGEDDLDLESEEGEESSEFDDDLDLEDEGEEGEESDEDLDMGEEFGDEEEDEESILKNIVKMMAAEAEARKAQYEAEAEKSRALQAEYSMKAAQEEMHKQEDLLSMEEEQKKQKEKEKEAKKLADLARYRLRGAVSESGEIKPAGLISFLSEISDLESETTVRLQRRNLRDLEDPKERALQTQLLNTKRRIIQQRNKMKQKQEEEEEEEMNQDQQNRDRSRQNPNQPVPDRRPIGGADR